MPPASPSNEHVGRAAETHPVLCNTSASSAETILVVFCRAPQCLSFNTSIVLPEQHTNRWEGAGARLTVGLMPAWWKEFGQQLGRSGRPAECSRAASKCAHPGMGTVNMNGDEARNRPVPLSSSLQGSTPSGVRARPCSARSLQHWHVMPAHHKGRCRWASSCHQREPDMRDCGKVSWTGRRPLAPGCRPWMPLDAGGAAAATAPVAARAAAAAWAQRLSSALMSPHHTAPQAAKFGGSAHSMPWRATSCRSSTSSSSCSFASASCCCA